MSSSPEIKGFSSKAKEAEYQALWQVCDRATRKGDYIYADNEAKRNILYNACAARLEKRRTQGKVMCGTNIVSMVGLHLQREVDHRLRAEVRMMQAPSFALNPVPNPVPFLADAQHHNGHPMPRDLSQNSCLGVPQHQHHVPTGPSGFDVPMHSESPIIRSMQVQLNTQANYIERLINTLRDYHGRIVSLEARVQDTEQGGRAAVPTQPAQPMYNAMQYTMEGLDGGSFAFPLARPITPSSQTQAGGGDEDDKEGGVPLITG